MVVEGRHILLWVLVPICFAHLDHRVPLRAKRGVVRVRVLRVGSIQRRELVGVDLRASYSTLEITFLQIACVEFDVVGQNTRVTFVNWIDEDLFDSIGIALMPLCHETLTHLLKAVLRVFVTRLHLNPWHDALLTVPTNRNAVLTLHLLLLAIVNCLVDTVLLLLVFDLQVILIVWIYFGMGPGADGNIHATSLDGARTTSNLQFPLHLPFVAVVA